MTLSSEDRRLYARHLLLPEIGAAGQERLLAAPTAPSGDPRAAEVATDYLRRAGVPIEPGGAPLPAGEPERLSRMAGDPSLYEAAAAVLGAFAAVERIKAVLGVGSPGEPPEVIG